MRWFWSLLFGVTLSFGSVSGLPQSALALEEREIPIQAAYLAAHGFDNNDNIELVLDGVLPGPCYRIAETSVEYLNPNTIRVRQFVTPITDGSCMPGAGTRATPFMSEVHLGACKAGAYRVQYLTPGGVVERIFTVDTAQSDEVDNTLYAPVTHVYLPETIKPGAEAIVLLSGSLTSTCMSLDESFTVEKVDDVYVILPGVRVAEDVLCLFVLTPFEREISIGRVETGRYLLHVRSLNGNSVNRLFTVTQ